ncbi:hypothetical protein CK203_066145 [Vitis vinifera]|uniref:Uncharacterized protein n=1 Tax=Vitis vinifera TaxID=29760 RepID=A0A438G3H0_VITVI|nr:hypothetical protein CK203_066145 [Vitis vinifera]
MQFVKPTPRCNVVKIYELKIKIHDAKQGGEEGQRNVMLENSNSNSNSMDGSTLSISKSNVNDGTMAATIAAPKAANSGKMERVKPIEKDSLCCSYYHKNHHTRENLWKLHDKPLNFFGKNNGGREGNSSYRS